MKIYPKSTLTFSKCLEMNLQDRIDVIAKVGEVAGKEYSIEQVENNHLPALLRSFSLTASPSRYQA